MAQLQQRATFDRVRMEADLLAIAEALLTVIGPQAMLMAKAMGLDIRSSISETCRDLAGLPDADLSALFDLLERELTGIHVPGGAPRAVLEREHAAIAKVTAILKNT